MPKHVTVPMLEERLRTFKAGYRISAIPVPMGTEEIEILLPEIEMDLEYDVLFPVTDWFTAIALKEKHLDKVVLAFWMAPPYDTAIDIRIAR